MMTPHRPPPLPEPRGFDYTPLDSQTRVVVQQRTSELKSLMRRTAQDIIEIGQKLIEVREELGYGNFRKWLKDEFSWSHPAATKFIQVAQQFGCINFMQVDIAASALYLLAAPSTPEEARLEALERAEQGEAITYALAKQIRSHHTIDIEAEIVKDDEEFPAPVQPPRVPEPQSQSESVTEPSTPTAEPETQPEILTDATPRPAESDQAPEKLESLVQKEPAPANDFKVGDRIRILCRQHGQDEWTGKTARVWQITLDGQLRVEVEGHKGVKFTLKPEWVERMPEEPPEQQNEQPVPALDDAWVDEPDPETPAIAEAPAEVQPEGEATPQFQAGDHFYLSDPKQRNRQWVGEVAEVIEASDNRTRVIVEISHPPE